MDQTSIESSCCICINFIGNSYSVITAILTYMDYQALLTLTNEPNIFSDLESLWSFGMAVTVSIAWVCFLPLNYAVRYGRMTLANGLGILLLVVLGPNLLGWAIFGTVIGTTLLDSASFDSLAAPIIACVNLILWCMLYMLAILLTYGLYRAIEDWVVSQIQLRTMERVREEIAESLPRCLVASDSSSICAICLDTFHTGEQMSELNGCSHHFHSSCIERWLQYSTRCPTCRDEVAAL